MGSQRLKLMLTYGVSEVETYMLTYRVSEVETYADI